MKVIIIGGSTSGTICAFELRKLNKNVEIKIIEESNNVQYSPCAMPYVIAGDTPREKIVLLTKKDYEDNNIQLLNNTLLKKIIPQENKITIINKEQNEETLTYDSLVLAMGSEPFNPGIKINSNNYSYFKTIQDLDKIIEDTRDKTKITIIGAGYIGVETAHALKSIGKEVVIIEAKNQILQTTLDNDLAIKIEEYLMKNGIRIIKETLVTEINKNKIITNKQEIDSDYTIISVGVKPKIKTARDANIETNKGIVTNEYQQTNFKNIYACGDCAEIKCAITNNNIITGLANTANMEARIVAKNILNINEKIQPSLSSSITKIGEYYVGNSGLNLINAAIFAENANEKIISTKHETYTTSQYYSTKNTIIIKLISTMNGKILGAQLISKENIAGYLNFINLAIKNKISLQDISNLETPYNPASNPLHDPLITTVNILLKKINFKNH